MKVKTSLEYKQDWIIVKHFSLCQLSSREPLTCCRMPGYRISAKRGRGCQLPVLVTVVILSALSALVSVLFWRLHYDGGFSWSSEPDKQFSWHPLLMTAVLACMGLGSTMYRVTPCVSR